MSTAKASETGAESCAPASIATSRALQPSAAVVFVVLLLVSLLFGVIRYRLRNMPLERDEGEYAYSGQLLLQGIPPYRLAYNMKLPGIYAAYAVIMWMFGETPAGIHSGLLLVNAATMIFLYFLTARLFGRLAGIVAACSWALLSTSTSVLGFEAHATNFVALPAVIGILLLVLALDRDEPDRNSWRLYLGSGLAIGVGVLMKQHGAFFVLFGVLYLFVSARGRPGGIARFVQRCAIFVAGALTPYAITCALLYRAEVFPQFWFWTVSYAGEYSKMGLRRAIHAFMENFASVVAPATAICILAAVGVSALWWNRGARRHRGFMGLFLLCSFLSVCPGAYFRPHYFVLLLPVIAMLTGVAIGAVTEECAESGERRLLFLPALVFAMFLAGSILTQARTFFLTDPETVFAETYPDSPFLAAPQIADYLRTHTSQADRIAVLGSEPEIYFHAQRPSATGYLYMYSLIVRHKYTARMREEFLSELERNKPTYLVYVDVWDSWGERTGVEQAEPFLAQLQKYMDDGYEKEGVADIGESTQYVWGDAARDYRPRSAKVIYVMRRKADVTGA